MRKLLPARFQQTSGTGDTASDLLWRAGRVAHLNARISRPIACRRLSKTPAQGRRKRTPGSLVCCAGPTNEGCSRGPECTDCPANHRAASVLTSRTGLPGSNPATPPDQRTETYSTMKSASGSPALAEHTPKRSHSNATGKKVRMGETLARRGRPGVNPV